MNKVMGYDIEPKAKLAGAHLMLADLSGANLKGAALQNARVTFANLKGCNLEGANLWCADFTGADLRDANLRNTNLLLTNFAWANLEGADLKGCKLPNFQITPEEGSFIGWKNTTKGLVKLLITDGAKRTNSLTSRLCRASKVVVLEGFADATSPDTGALTYETGATIKVDEFDDDIRIPKGKGISFYMTQDETGD